MSKLMKERFLIHSTMHMGPICRNLNAGDVVTWSEDTNTLAINGSEIPNDGHKDSKDGFVRAVKALEKLAYMKPEQVSIAEAVEVRDRVSPKTDTLVVFPILGCLKAVEDYLKNRLAWLPKNDKQAQFLELFIENIEDVDDLKCLERKADINSESINRWLREHGFDIQLDPVTGGFHVASILDVLVKWLKRGRKTEVRNDNGSFPAVNLKDGVAAYKQPDLHPYPVVRIRTQSDDVVCMSIATTMPDDTFALHWEIEKLREVKRPYGAEGVIFPMVKYDRMVDISWIEGMRTKATTNHGEYFIAKALQQTKFRMNEDGARAESAMAMTLGVSACISENPWVIIDKPFILWIERAGVELPLFAGCFAEDSWENPGGLA